MKSVLSTTCYGDLKLPRLIGPQAEDFDTVMQAMAGSESLNALFIGGMTESSQFKPVSGKTASVFRLDLQQNSWVWRKTFTCSACSSFEVVTALAVNQDDTKVSAYATNYAPEYYSPKGYIFVVGTADGHYVAGIHEIVHGSSGR